MSGKYKVPERWEKYTNMGRIIPGTRFITFKVPLRQEIMQKVKNAGWFCPRTLLDHCHNMAIVIDLTDTFRYYDPEEFESRGVTHQKIRVRGREIPEERVVQKFYQAVNKFLEKNKENDKVIGVHCTHGINRSGYLVCRYMIQVLGIPPDQAIADFNSARGHEQERENYLVNLRQAVWMNDAIPRYIKKTPTPKDGSEYPTSNLDDSTASLNTTNNTSLDTTNSEAESPGPSSRSWNIPLLKYPGAPEDESGGSLPPLRRWSPVEERESRRSSRRARRHNPMEKNSSGDRDRDRSSKRHQERYSAYGARSYYDQIYQGRIAPQYDSHFYQQQGSGVGPHRARYHRQQEQHQHQHHQHQHQHNHHHHQHHQGPSNAPRQYRGPRPYRSPPATDTNTTPARQKPSDYFSTPGRQRSSDHFNSYRSPPAADTTSTPIRQEKSSDYFRTPDASSWTPRPRSHGPMRNPLSPGQREDVFSPITPRRSARMTPY